MSNITRPTSCPTCSKEFPALLSELKRGGAKYCSIDCYRKSPRKDFRGTPEERFWRFVDKKGPEDCWLWNGSTTKPGNNGQIPYGMIGIDGKNRKAHRVSWEIHNGPIQEGMNVLHNCPTGDDSMCVNPGHLWLGTLKDNMQDCIKKGRFYFRSKDQNGIRNPYAKMTPESVSELRRLYSEGWTRKELAEKFGIHQTNAWYIIQRRTWKEVP